MAMQEPTFFILTALAEQPRHGYGVIQAVESLSDGRIRLRAGTLYAALDRLAADGLVALHREEAVEGRLRRYYRLTEQGVTGLAAEVERLRTNAAIAAAQIPPSAAPSATPSAAPPAARPAARPAIGPA